MLSTEVAESPRGQAQLTKAGEMSDLDAVMKKLNGVARSTTLDSFGIPRHARARAVQSGELVRVKRGWLAQKDADPYLVSAARAGVWLTCVTQARRLGLWVLADEHIHVVAPQGASGIAVAPGTVVHWAKPVVPRHPDSLVDPLENVLALVANCQPHEVALAIWESALNKGLVDLASLARLDLPPRARALCDEADPFADSGFETIVVPRLKWLRLPLRRQIWIHGHRVDLLIGDRLVLQIDGAHHTGAQRDQDIAHDAALMLLGYHVIRVSYGQIVHRWEQVQDLIMRAVAQGLHLAR